MTPQNAAEDLAGHTLDSGWQVKERIEKPAGATGGFFSVCYLVERAHERCFLKAYNFASFLALTKQSGHARSVVDVVSDMLDAYKYERDLSALCRQRHVTRVAFVRESGEHLVPGYAITVVPYLVFDIADGGDVRTHLTFSRTVEASWKLKSLHSIAVGLRQLHTIDVSHQDLKPSNVLLFSGESRLGDLGRSQCLALVSPHGTEEFTGEFTYAPPEVLYAHVEPDWRRRSFGTDLYLLGSLIAFYFSGLTMTALLRRNLPNDVSWEYFRGAYEDVQAHVMSAFRLALDEFEASIPEGQPLRRALRDLVLDLCHPVPAQRATASGPFWGSAVDLERVVSRLNLLHRRARFGLLDGSR